MAPKTIWIMEMRMIAIRIAAFFRGLMGNGMSSRMVGDPSPACSDIVRPVLGLRLIKDACV